MDPAASFLYHEKTTMTDSLDSFLSSNSDVKKSHGGRKCLCCSNAKLKAEIDAFLDKVAAGETEVPLEYLFEKFLLPKHGQPRHVNSVYGHVKRCLRRDRHTGKPLDGEA